MILAWVSLSLSESLHERLHESRWKSQSALQKLVWVQRWGSFVSQDFSAAERFSLSLTCFTCEAFLFQEGVQLLSVQLLVKG